MVIESKEHAARPWLDAEELNPWQGDSSVSRKHGAGGACKAKKSRREQVYSPSCEFKTKHEDAVRTAVEESMRRFLENNRDSIKRSSKQKVASASYCGGMVDMITLIRSALGRWAVEELLVELEEWNRAPAAGSQSQVRVRVDPSELGGLSEEDAEELGEHIAKWIEERTSNGKQQHKDPMFA